MTHRQKKASTQNPSKYPHTNTFAPLLPRLITIMSQNNGYYQVGTQQPYYGGENTKATYSYPTATATTTAPTTAYTSPPQPQSYGAANPAPTTDTYPADYDPIKAQSDESTALLLLIVSFFFGGMILWLIVYLMYRNSVSPKARLLAKIAGVLCLLSLIPLLLSIVFVIIYVIVIVVLASRRTTP